jgi:hypothetical protein
MTKLKDTDLHVRKIKYIWVAPLLKGDVKDEDMNDVMVDLIFKIICEDDLCLDDFMAAQAYLMTKITPQKKS